MSILKLYAFLLIVIFLSGIPLVSSISLTGFGSSFQSQSVSAEEQTGVLPSSIAVNPPGSEAIALSQSQAYENAVSLAAISQYLPSSWTYNGGTVACSLSACEFQVVYISPGSSWLAATQRWSPWPYEISFTFSSSDDLLNVSKPYPVENFGLVSSSSEANTVPSLSFCSPSSTNGCGWSGAEYQWCGSAIFGYCTSTSTVSGSEFGFAYPRIGNPNTQKINAVCCETSVWVGVGDHVDASDSVLIQTGVTLANNYLQTLLGFSNGWFYQNGANNPATLSADPSYCTPSSGDQMYTYVISTGISGPSGKFQTYVQDTTAQCAMASAATTNSNLDPTWEYSVMEAPETGNGPAQWPSFSTATFSKLPSWSQCTSQSTTNNECGYAWILGWNNNQRSFNTNADPVSWATAYTDTNCPGGAHTNAYPGSLSDGISFLNTFFSSEYC